MPWPLAWAQGNGRHSMGASRRQPAWLAQQRCHVLGDQAAGVQGPGALFARGRGKVVDVATEGAANTDIKYLSFFEVLFIWTINLSPSLDSP